MSRPEKKETTSSVAPEDLSALARRGALSAAGHRRLDVARGASPALRVLHDAGCAFDEVPFAVSGDEALVKRLAMRARTRGERSRQAGRTPGMARLMLLTLGVAASASVATAVVLEARDWGVFRSMTEPSGRASDAAHDGARPPRARLPGASPTHPAETETGIEEGAPTTAPASKPTLAAGSSVSKSPARAPAGGSPSKRAVAPSKVRLPTVLPPEDSTPGGLFSEANTARRQGKTQRAIALYRRLQLEHPASREAQTSHVVLGRISLNGGDAGTALQEFDAYLRQAPRGALAQEALHGKARALARLGRHEEERLIWQYLLTHYPTSVYAAAARERLTSQE